MKKILLLTLILWAGSISANKVTDSLKANINPICYNRMFLGAGLIGVEGGSLVGLELGYTRGIRLAAETRHYLEVGVGLYHITLTIPERKPLLGMLDVSRKSLKADV